MDEREKVLQALLAKEKVLQLLYRKTFPDQPDTVAGQAQRCVYSYFIYDVVDHKLGHLLWFIVVLLLYRASSSTLVFDLFQNTMLLVLAPDQGRDQCEIVDNIYTLHL